MTEMAKPNFKLLRKDLMKLGYRVVGSEGAGWSMVNDRTKVTTKLMSHGYEQALLTARALANVGSEG